MSNKEEPLQNQLFAIEDTIRRKFKNKPDAYLVSVADNGLNLLDSIAVLRMSSNKRIQKTLQNRDKILDRIIYNYTGDYSEVPDLIDLRTTIINPLGQEDDIDLVLAGIGASIAVPLNKRHPDYIGHQKRVFALDSHIDFEAAYRDSNPRNLTYTVIKDFGQRISLSESHQIAQIKNPPTIQEFVDILNNSVTPENSYKISRVQEYYRRLFSIGTAKAQIDKTEALESMEIATEFMSNYLAALQSPDLEADTRDFGYGVPINNQMDIANPKGPTKNTTTYGLLQMAATFHPSLEERHQARELMIAYDGNARINFDLLDLDQLTTNFSYSPQNPVETGIVNSLGIPKELESFSPTQDVLKQLIDMHRHITEGKQADNIVTLTSSKVHDLNKPLIEHLVDKISTEHNLDLIFLTDDTWILGYKGAETDNNQYKQQIDFEFHKQVRDISSQQKDSFNLIASLDLFNRIGTEQINEDTIALANRSRQRALRGKDLASFGNKVLFEEDEYAYKYGFNSIIFKPNESGSAIFALLDWHGHQLQLELSNTDYSLTENNNLTPAESQWFSYLVYPYLEHVTKETVEIDTDPSIEPIFGSKEVVNKEAHWRLLQLDSQARNQDNNEYLIDRYGIDIDTLNLLFWRIQENLSISTARELIDYVTHELNTSNAPQSNIKLRRLKNLFKESIRKITIRNTKYRRTQWSSIDAGTDKHQSFSLTRAENSAKNTDPYYSLQWVRAHISDLDSPKVHQSPEHTYFPRSSNL